MIITKSTAISLPVILVDDTDFKTPETSVAYNAAGMSVKYRNPAAATTWSTKSLTPAGEDVYWTELGNGLYLVTFTAAQIGATTGQFLYFCTATGILPFWGTAQVVTYNPDEVSLMTQFLFTTLAGYGLHLMSQKDISQFGYSSKEARKVWSSLPENLKTVAIRNLTFYSKNFGSMKSSLDSMRSSTTKKKSKNSRPEETDFKLC